MTLELQKFLRADGSPEKLKEQFGIISRDEEGETHIRLVFHTRNRPAGSMPIKQVLGMTLSNSEFQDLKGEES